MKATGLIVITGIIFTAAAQTPARFTCSSSGNNKADDDYGKNKDENSSSNCLIWPLNQVPLEHRDISCNRALQNLEWNAAYEITEATPKEELIPNHVYLRLPEEKTWECPLDTADVPSALVSSNFLNTGRNNNEEGGDYAGGGHPTKWVLYNKASTPIILTHINALGLEVSASDGAYPPHSNPAVFPHGPIVLPNQMAVIKGVQGHLFYAREYNEAVLTLNPIDAEEDTVSWKNAGAESFKKSLPRTLSFLSHQSRYEASNGVSYVLGYPGRVLMKHRMGLIYVKNDSGAQCPEIWGRGLGAEDKDEGRRGNPRDSAPLCNILRKAFINKVGCPIDIYFAPQNVKGESSIECEKFTNHLGPIHDFLAAEIPNLDGYTSPLKFENTYNGHSFVARMSHDQSFVARIEIDHDIVRDCPEPTQPRSSSVVEVHADETIMINNPFMVINATKDTVGSAFGYNTSTLAPILKEKSFEEKSGSIFLNSHNQSGIKTSLHIAT